VRPERQVSRHVDRSDSSCHHAVLCCVMLLYYIILLSFQTTLSLLHNSLLRKERFIVIVRMSDLFPPILSCLTTSFRASGGENGRFFFSKTNIRAQKC
jgi:hypothetical protein